MLLMSRPVYLDRSVEINSSVHTERTAGSVWDCSLIMAKYFEKHSSILAGCDQTIASARARVRHCRVCSIAPPRLCRAAAGGRPFVEPYAWPATSIAWAATPGCACVCGVATVPRARRRRRRRGGGATMMIFQHCVGHAAC